MSRGAPELGRGRERARWLARILAIAVPLSIVAGSLLVLASERFQSFADAREDRNAGKVINGRVVSSTGVAATIDAKLDKYEPQVVILGNSLSNTDLNPGLLADGLDIPANKVQKFSIPNSMAAHWYAIVKNRIYGNGHAPRIVLILSDLQSLLALSPRSEASYLNLAVQLGPDEPVIDEKLGQRNYYLEKVRENRGRLRDLALLGVRNRMVDLLVHHTLTPTNPKDIERALSEVFDASRVDMRLHSNALPIFNAQNSKDLLPFDPHELPMPQDSFLAEMARLVQENGGHLVYLRPPMSPIMPEGVGDIVLPEHEKGVYELMDQYGGTFLDLREVEMDVTHFQNPDHMNAEGARRFTRIVTELLSDVGGGGPPTAELLKTVGLVKGRYAALPLDVAFKEPPPPLSRVDRTFSKGRGRTLYFPAETWSFLNDQATGLVSPHATRCSPLRVLEDGAPLPHPNESCDDVLKQGRGRTCHTPDKVFFTTPDGTNPYLTDREYRLVLDPMRTCDGGLWLYPGDRVRLTARAYDLAALRRGAATLTAIAADMGAVRAEVLDPRVDIRVRAGGEPRAEVAVTIPDLTTTGVLVRLDPRVGPNERFVQIELENRSDRYLLLTSLLLANRGSGG